MKIPKYAGSAVDVFLSVRYVHLDVMDPGLNRSYAVAAAIISHYHNRKVNNHYHIIVKQKYSK